MSSTSNQRVGVQFVADKGNIDLVAEAWIARLNQIGEAGGRLNTQMSLWQRQWQAFGTTIRYAIAGGAIYGLLGTVQDLNQFQRGMGDIAAIFDTTTNKVGSLRSELKGLGSDLLEISAKTLTPIDQLQQAVTQIESSVPRYTRASLSGVANVLAQTSATTQGTDIQDLVNALVGGARGAGLSLAPKDQVASTQKLGDWFFRVIQTSIGMTGPQFVQQAGRLLQTMPSANLRGEPGLRQLGYYASLATFLGGSPASNERAMSQLLQTIRTPTGAHIKAFQQIGLSPQRMANMTAPQVIDTILRRVSPGLKVNTDLLKNLDDTQVTDDASVNAGFSGPGAQMLMRLIGRAESRRMIALMASTAGSPDAVSLRQAFGRDLDFGNVSQAQKQRLDQEVLATAANKTHVAIVQLGRDFEDVINPVAKLEGAFADLTRHNPGITTVAVGAAAGLAASRAIASLMRGTAAGDAVGSVLARLPGGSRLARLTGFAGTAGRAAMSTALLTESLPQLIAGGTGIGASGAGSRSNPLWVIIHPDSQYFIDLGNKPSTGAGGNIVKDAEQAVGKGGGAAGAARVAGLGLGAAGSILTIAALAAWYGTMGPHAQVGAFIPNHLYPGRLGHLPGFSGGFNNLPVLAQLQQYGGNVTPQMKMVLAAVDQHKITTRQAESFLEQMNTHKDTRITGEATVTVRVEASDEAKKLIKIAAEQAVAGVTMTPDSRPTVGGKNASTRHRKR